MPHILVVDDDNKIRSLIKQFLEEYDYIVSTAYDASNALEKLNYIKYDLIVLDIMMPGKSGLELTQELKKKIKTPIILLTAKVEVTDRIYGLDVGADDYISKPFEPKELLLRIKNILNKTMEAETPNFIKIGIATINLKKQEIQIKNKFKKINNAEKKILEMMVLKPGKVFSRNEIGEKINLEKERTIDVMITRLRQKIESDPKNPKYLQTIRGSGYVLWIE